MADELGGVKEIDDLVEDWTPEPLVTKATTFEEADIEKRPVIVGLECLSLSRHRVKAAPNLLAAPVVHDPSSLTAER